MNIPKEMMQSFNKAVSLVENLQLDGSVNWNYIDADVYMDMSAKKLLDDKWYMVWFDKLASDYEAANGVQVQTNQICEDVSSLSQQYTNNYTVYTIYTQYNATNITVKHNSGNFGYFEYMCYIQGCKGYRGYTVDILYTTVQTRIEDSSRKISFQ